MSRSSSPYGLHRVLFPLGAFPQAAKKVDTSLPIHDNELLIEVDRLNLDSASFHQLWEANHHSKEKLKKSVLKIVLERGKMHNPVTNSGGTLLGSIQKIGSKHPQRKLFKKGDRVATLVSLSLTPLHLASIEDVDASHEQLSVKGYAILFESSLLEKLPSDLPESLVLSIFDVCGAPALVSKLTKKNDTVVILGAGKAGFLSAAAARQKTIGKIIILDKNPHALRKAKPLPFVDSVYVADSRNAVATEQIVRKATRGKMADLVVNCVNVTGTEMASILSAKKMGTVLFFNMATNFQAAVLGAEGIGHPARLVMGNGYTPGHARLAISLVRKGSANIF